MIVRILKASLPIALLLATSCGSGYSLLKTQRMSETSLLKAECAAKGLEADAADSLYTQATALSDAGKDKEAHQLADRAALQYRLALAQNELRKSESRLLRSQNDLEKVKEQTTTYERILQELRAGTP
jgi:hypothetical protein